MDTSRDTARSLRHSRYDAVDSEKGVNTAAMDSDDFSDCSDTSYRADFGLCFVAFMLVLLFTSLNIVLFSQMSPVAMDILVFAQETSVRWKMAGFALSAVALFLACCCSTELQRQAALVPESSSEEEDASVTESAESRAPRRSQRRGPCLCFVYLFTWVSLLPGVGSIILLYPAYPVLMTFLVSMLGLVALKCMKVICYRRLDLAVWLDAVTKAMLTVGFLCGASWCGWLISNYWTIPDWDKWTDWTPEYKQKVADGHVSWSLAFVAWCTPFFLSLELFVLGLLALFRRHQAIEMSHDVDHHLTDDEQLLVGRLKQLAMLLTAFSFCLYAFASFEATIGSSVDEPGRGSMADEVLFMLGLVLLSISVWTIHVIGKDKIYRVMKSSKVVESMVKVLDSDWAHASVVFFPVLPFFCVSAFIRDHVRRWYWTGVLEKVIYLGVLYFTWEVGFGKATYIMLAYTDDLLKGLDLYVVVTAIFLVGFFLFMLPPTPGVPVYMIVGIVITGSAQNAGWSFVASVSLAIAVGFAVKMAFAIAAQKLIGEPLGNSASVRRLCQVHTMEMRAIEYILNRPTLTLAKVAILIGGPDWPVAVFCGILHLRLLPIVLGICPVLFQSVIPCVLSGALLSSKDKEQQELGSSCLGIAAALQLVAGLVAAYYLQEVIEEKSEELSVPREEDKEVLRLDAEAEARKERDMKLIRWDVLPCFAKVALLLGVLFVEAMLIVLFFGKSLFGSPCFKAFKVGMSVQDDLGGDPFSIVLFPGRIACACLAASLLCLGVFRLWATRKVGSYSDNVSD